MAREKVANEKFHDQDISLDGKSWFSCNFYNCNIILERGDFDLALCKFNGCKLTAKGNAISILKVAKLFFPGIPLIE